ncbi:uncharacterized protein IWZ02DRAFT_438291, partial [Phyllosticta citriasiana]|uniref:Secreted protein n=1 Tax=Phyllosticta citriasiana TaxID=595635 RepID=A0ABR1KG08_9PEZI
MLCERQMKKVGFAFASQIMLTATLPCPLLSSPLLCRLNPLSAVLSLLCLVDAYHRSTQRNATQRRQTAQSYVRTACTHALHCLFGNGETKARRDVCDVTYQ